MPTQEIYFKDEDGNVSVYENIEHAIRISDTKVRVELDDGRKAKNDGRIIAVVGDWDIWTYYPNGNLADAKMEGWESVPRAYELPEPRGIMVFDPWGDGKETTAVCGREIRRAKRAEA